MKPVPYAVSNLTSRKGSGRALRAYIERSQEPLEAILRRVVLTGRGQAAPSTTRRAGRWSGIGLGTVKPVPYAVSNLTSRKGSGRALRAYIERSQEPLEAILRRAS